MLISRSIYHGLLRRSASARVLAAKEIAIWTQGGLAKELHRVLLCDEFKVMVLPDLVAQSASAWSGRYVFFLHVPKTAGTAFRLALTEAVGIPAIMAYDRIDMIRPEDFRGLHFWPLLAGHGHVDDFPSSHRGVTTLREPRSRLLSLYRMAQRNPLKGPHGRFVNNPTDRSALWHEAISIPFESWLRKRARPQYPYFAAGLKIDEDFGAHPVGSTAVQSALKAGLARFDACAWMHDADGLRLALSTVTGRQCASLGMANEFRDSRYSQRVTISREVRSLLDQFAQADRGFFALAEDLLGLPNLADSEADRLFESTASRLGFALT